MFINFLKSILIGLWTQMNEYSPLQLSMPATPLQKNTIVK